LGDPTRIKQVLYNLVSNALKFTQSGSVLVTISAEDVGENRRALSFAVKDSGIGIEPDVQGRLFERFSQAVTSIFDNPDTRIFFSPDISNVRSLVLRMIVNDEHLIMRRTSVENLSSKIWKMFLRVFYGGNYAHRDPYLTHSAII
jgi:hypothetical protein